MPISTPRKKAPALSRRMAPQLRPAIRQHAQGVGEVMFAWNYMHASFCAIFAVLVDGAKMTQGLEIWHSLPSDTMQRNALLAALRGKLPENSKLRTGIEWSVAQAVTLSKHRNDAAHVSMSFQFDADVGSKWNVVPEYLFADPKRVNRLRRVSIRQIQRALRGDLHQLGHYNWWIFRHLTGVTDIPLPRRPRLQAVKLFESAQNP